jgi:hypothetical protein
MDSIVQKLLLLLNIEGCLEKIGMDALFDASNNATTNESKTEVSV